MIKLNTNSILLHFKIKNALSKCDLVVLNGRKHTDRKQYVIKQILLYYKIQMHVQVLYTFVFVTITNQSFGKFRNISTYPVNCHHHV